MNQIAAATSRQTSGPLQVRQIGQTFGAEVRGMPIDGDVVRNCWRNLFRRCIATAFW